MVCENWASAARMAHASLRERERDEGAEGADAEAYTDRAYPAAEVTLDQVQGAITADIAKLFVVGLPALLVGTWLGLTLFGRLDEASFRKVVLGLLLLSGVALVLTRY